MIQLDGREVMVPLVWLRDHCRCPVCYNAVLFQKNVDCYSLGNLAVMESRVDGDTLSVKCKGPVCVHVMCNLCVVMCDTCVCLWCMYLCLWFV